MSTGACYPDKSPMVNRLLHTLEDEIRREVIHYFENVTGRSSTTFDELVVHVDKRVPHVDERQLRTALWHQHLPILRERDWIETDPRNEQIRYHGHDSAERLLNDLAAVFE